MSSPPDEGLNRSRPNVLFLMDDQHSARCLGCYGNETVETPHLDRLASKGVRFDRAYAQSPICLPSRTSIFTGRYPHSLGVYGNYGALDADVRSLAFHLNAHGYDTGAFGKLYLPVDWPTKGFDVQQSCDFADTVCHEDENDYYAYLKRVGFADEYDLGIGCQEYPHKTYVSNIPAEHSVEQWTADETISWLENRDGDAPFFAWSTFQRPHPPYAPPPEYADYYVPENVELPPRASNEFKTKPDVWRQRSESNLYQRSDERDIRQVVTYYYALITLIDDQICRILNYLESAGELDNTIIVFTSDHGDFAGEHGFVSKNVGISEAIHRIPLIWRYPSEFETGTDVDDLTELVDIFPTLCDVLNVPIQNEVQGRSLKPTLTNGTPVGRKAAYCIHQHLRTIRTDEWKLTYYPEEDDGELYNMTEDPWEHKNLYHRDAYRDVRSDLLRRLFAFHVETEEPVIPSSSGIPIATSAHAAWSKRWWETGGSSNPTPLAHLGGPGYDPSANDDLDDSV
jgi:arylsulfatase